MKDYRIVNGCVEVCEWKQMRHADIKGKCEGLLLFVKDGVLSCDKCGTSIISLNITTSAQNYKRNTGASD